MNLTPIKLEILQTFKEFQEKKHYSPTMKELAKQLGKSRTTVFEHCSVLRQKGYLSASKGKVRSLKLTPQAEKILFSLSEPMPDPVVSEQIDGIPFLGTVAAGFPVEPLAISERISIETEFVSRDPVFALQVSGESMVDDNIFPGDYVVCRQANSAKQGDLVVAIVDDTEATLKRFFREKDHIRLQPANCKYTPIITTNCQIKGVVVGLIRKM